MTCDTPINNNQSSCSPNLGQHIGKIKLTPEQVIDNIKRIIREEHNFCGLDIASPKKRKALMWRIEHDLFIMKKLTDGKLKRAARTRLTYGRFTREELADIYNEIKSINE